MELTIVSKRNLPDKAAIALLDKARKAGYSQIDAVDYELLPPSTQFIHKFTTIAS